MKSRASFILLLSMFPFFFPLANTYPSPPPIFNGNFTSCIALFLYSSRMEDHGFIQHQLWTLCLGCLRMGLLYLIHSIIQDIYVQQCPLCWWIWYSCRRVHPENISELAYPHSRLLHDHTRPYC